MRWYRTLREVCEELKPYIDDAAAATGPKGTPARLLAAALLMEVWGRPKEGSPKARQIRKSLQGEEYEPRLQAIEDKIKGAFGMKVKKTHLDSIRDVELDLIREFLNEFETLSLSVRANTNCSSPARNRSASDRSPRPRSPWRAARSSGGK